MFFIGIFNGVLKKTPRDALYAHAADVYQKRLFNRVKPNIRETIPARSRRTVMMRPAMAMPFFGRQTPMIENIRATSHAMARPTPGIQRTKSRMAKVMPMAPQTFVGDSVLTTICCTAAPLCSVAA